MRTGADQTNFPASFARGYQPPNLVSTIKQAFDVSSKASGASRTCIASNLQDGSSNAAQQAKHRELACFLADLCAVHQYVSYTLRAPLEIVNYSI